jgi:peptide deformylase
MYNSIEQIKVFYPLQTWENNEILRKKSENVDIFDDEIKEFSEILLDLMYAYDGVWLAAPQVGKNIRVIATTQWKEIKKWNKTDKRIIWETAMINPEILERSEEKRKWEEACLSVPGLCGDVERWTWIVVKYQDKKWKFHIQKYTWFSAVVIQHEMDHLDWVLFTDKVIGKIRKIDNKSEY